ncbi:MAG: HAMP domain-containing sensor histidine kinase [Acidimicrobiales bacterium]
MRKKLTIALMVAVFVSVISSGVGVLLISTRIERTQAISDMQHAVSTLENLAITHPARFHSLLVHRARVGTEALSLLRSNGTTTATGVLRHLIRQEPTTDQLLNLQQVIATRGNHLFLLTPVSLKSPVDGASVAIFATARVIAGSFASGLFIVLLALFVLALAYVIARALSGRITKAFYALIETTRGIAKGEIHERLPIKHRPDTEVAELFDAIKHMATDLEGARAAERQFLLSISHELRTPLTSIVGFSESIIDGAIDDPRRAAETILKESRRLEHLVGDLLELASLQSSHFSLEISEVSLNQLVDDLANGYRRKCDDLGLSFRYRPLTTGLTISTDPTRFLQVLENFLENACKFTTSEVAVSAHFNARGAVISVIDDGPGIDESDRVHLFNEQYRSPRLAAKTKGSGLGLMIAGQLARALGLEVSFRSPLANSGGTEMRLHIPARVIHSSALVDTSSLSGPTEADSPTAATAPRSHEHR